MDTTQYKDVYVFCEQREGVIQSVALELLGKARELADTLNEKVVAILLGKDIKAKAQDLIAAGADKVSVVDNDVLKYYLTEPYTQAITQIISEQKPSILMIGATTIGRDLGPRVSSCLHSGLTADCTSLEIGNHTDPKTQKEYENLLWLIRNAFDCIIVSCCSCPLCSFCKKKDE